MVLHHVGWHGAVEAVGHLDGVVHGVLHQGPGGEGGARHHDRAVKQAWHQMILENIIDEVIMLMSYYVQRSNFNEYRYLVWRQVSTVLSIKFKVKLMKFVLDIPKIEAIANQTKYIALSKLNIVIVLYFKFGRIGDKSFRLFKCSLQSLCHLRHGTLKWLSNFWLQYLPNCTYVWHPRKALTCYSCR